jgi:hypothetical protein
MLIFAPCGLSNLVAQSDQVAPLLIQMSGVRLEQRKQDLIRHGEAMLKAIHLAPRTHKLRRRAGLGLHRGSRDYGETRAGYHPPQSLSAWRIRPVASPTEGRTAACKRQR